MKALTLGTLSVVALITSCGKSDEERKERKERKANTLTSAEVMASAETQSQILNESH